MRITADQQKIIESLSCERLSSNRDNMWLIDGFYNHTNDVIAQNLLNDAFSDDENNSIAYYLIKDSDGDILFYFSLKCGLLYDEFLEGERLRTLHGICDYIIDKKKQTNLSDEDKRKLGQLLELLRSKKGIQKRQVADALGGRADINEINIIFNSGQHHVGKTYSGVELVHFCANDQYRFKWNLKKPLGAVVFWQFVVPQVIEVMKFVGCEYLFLFAADLTPDEYLVNYYRQYLGFTDELKHMAAMPIYDLACKFMYQKTADLAEKRKAFFDNFNPDKDAV